MQISLLQYNVTVLISVLNAPFYKMENRSLLHQGIVTCTTNICSYRKRDAGNLLCCQEIQHLYSWKDDVTVETDHKPLEAIFKKSLLAAPICLQRMLLQLQRYNLKVKYIKGSTQYIAYLLSRAIPPNSLLDADSKSFDVFCLGLDNISYAEYTSVSKNSQAEIKVATDNDLLKATVMKGWPDNKEQAPAMIQEY